MRYASINSCDLINTLDGVVVSFWVQGCPHKCDGCFNPETWDFNGGKEYTTETKNRLVKLVSSEYVDGLSILGGEPFAPYHREAVLDLIRTIKSLYPNKRIMVWTGYKLENLKFDLDGIDYIVDGRFEKNLPTKKKLRGSDNQRLIDIKNNYKIID